VAAASIGRFTHGKETRYPTCRRLQRIRVFLNVTLVVGLVVMDVSEGSCRHIQASRSTRSPFGLGMLGNQRSYTASFARRPLGSHRRVLAIFARRDGEKPRMQRRTTMSNNPEG